MRPYARYSGGSAPKKSTQSHAGRHNQGIERRGDAGTTIPDKTSCCSSRPGAKEKIRNARRADKKRTRQRLKREMRNEHKDDEPVPENDNQCSDHES